MWIGRAAPSAFPLGTFLVNISGCLLIGLLYGMASKFGWFTMEWRLLLITGICGGYTTFSSYSYEGISLLRQGNYLYFGLYVGGSVVLGLLATFLGTILIK
jgi:CrcB protein